MTYHGFLLGATLDVTVTAETGVAGGVQGDASERYTMNAVAVRGDVSGTTEWIGGICGGADSAFVHYTTFDGTVRGGSVGGFTGESYDGLAIHHSSAHVTLTGNQGVGGFVGNTYYWVRIHDSFVTGSIASSGDNPTDAGGFSGSIYYDFTAHNSYADIDVLSAFSRAGGFAGDAGWFDGTADLQHLFTTGDVSGANLADTVSLSIGVMDDPTYTAPTFANVYYWAGASCLNTGGGNCNTDWGTPVQHLEDFYVSSQPHFSSWDFVTVWQENAGALPTLRPKANAPVITGHTCPATATAGEAYSCVVSVTDADPHDVARPLVDRNHTCRWANFGEAPTTLAGTPPLDDYGLCRLSFYATDGVFDSPPQTVTVQVR